MATPLSPRLQTCCSFIAPGDRVADIGCDHGYLSLYLLENQIASSVIAADVNEMPLRSAIRNAEKFGVQDKISFYLSDGVQSIPRDFDTMVCAGMGADTMVSILDGAPWLQDPRYRLILQCQSKTSMLRRYLSDHGWYINQEKVLRDGRFLYTVMEVLWQPALSGLSAGQCHFPPAMLKEPSPEVREYYERICFSLSRAVFNRGENADPQDVQALQELQLLAQSPALQQLQEESL